MLDASKRSLSAVCGCASGSFAVTAVSRRAMLACGTSVLAAAAGGFAAKSFAQSAPRRIDVHHHLASPCKP